LNGSADFKNKKATNSTKHKKLQQINGGTLKSGNNYSSIVSRRLPTRAALF